MQNIGRRRRHLVVVGKNFGEGEGECNNIGCSTVWQGGGSARVEHSGTALGCIAVPRETPGVRRKTTDTSDDARGVRVMQWKGGS